MAGCEEEEEEEEEWIYAVVGYCWCWRVVRADGDVAGCEEEEEEEGNSASCSSSSFNLSDVKRGNDLGLDEFRNIFNY